MSHLFAHVTVLGIEWGAWKFTGQLTAIDLIAASTNAFNGALLARRPDHYKGFTVVGILLMAILGGLGGGITRDVLLNDIPSALTNPAYIFLCVAFGIAGYLLAYGPGQLFREGWFQFATAFSLPWYAIVGAQKTTEAGLPILAALMIGVIGATAGRYYIDITCGVPAKQFIQGEWFVGTALLSAGAWIGLHEAGVESWVAIAGAFLVGFVFRVAAMYRGWEAPLAAEPQGTEVHGEGKVLLGRKLTGKSQRELKKLGLLPEAEPADS